MPLDVIKPSWITEAAVTTPLVVVSLISSQAMASVPCGLAVEVFDASSTVWATHKIAVDLHDIAQPLIDAVGDEARVERVVLRGAVSVHPAVGVGPVDRLGRRGDGGPVVGLRGLDRLGQSGRRQDTVRADQWDRDRRPADAEVAPLCRMFVSSNAVGVEGAGRLAGGIARAPGRGCPRRNSPRPAD